jgi:hypothetical protein
VSSSFINSKGTLGFRQHPTVLNRGIIWGIGATSFGGIALVLPGGRRIRGSIRGIEAYHERGPFFLANALGHHIGGCLGGCSSHQYSPHRGTAGMENQPRGSILAFERGAHMLGAVLILERADLDGIPILGGCGGGNREDVEADARHSRSDESDSAGGGVRNIDDAVFDERPAVGNADIDRFVVAEIHHAHPGTERQRAMRGSETFHVVDFAIGGGAAVIRMPVPASESGFAGADRLRRS